jgi:hypothetical protein
MTLPKIFQGGYHANFSSSNIGPAKFGGIPSPPYHAPGCTPGQKIVWTDIELSGYGWLKTPSSPAMKFKISEPCEVLWSQLNNSKWIFEKDDYDFWHNTPAKKYKNSAGCYLIATNEPNGNWVPWYAGMTQRTMWHEVFAHAKLLTMLELLNSAERILHIFFFTPLKTNTKVPSSIIYNIENFLISASNKVNKFIFNKKGKLYHPTKEKWEIYSFDETGRTQEIFCEMLKFPRYYLQGADEEITDSPWEQFID